MLAPDLSEKELHEYLVWIGGRHHDEEWRAGLDYYSRPRWQRRILKVLGALSALLLK